GAASTIVLSSSCVTSGFFEITVTVFKVLFLIVNLIFTTTGLSVTAMVLTTVSYPIADAFIRNWWKGGTKNILLSARLTCDCSKIVSGNEYSSMVALVS